MKRPKNKYIHLPLPIEEMKRLEKLAKSQNTFPTRLAAAIVSDAIPRIESGDMAVEAQRRVGK